MKKMKRQPAPMPMAEYLRQRLVPEKMPAWLREFGDRSAFNRKSFFATRTVYYPGSGLDGHAIELFGGAHAAHTFVQVDYGLSRQRLERRLARPGFPGYDTRHRQQLEEAALVPDGWTPHAQTRTAAKQGQPQHFFLERRRRNPEPYAFLEILERKPGLPRTHGPSRLAILFLSADGVAAYDVLYCQKYEAQRPFALVLQDHRFSGNYTRFGEGGLLCQLAQRCRVFPYYLLTAANTRLWQGYEQLPEALPVRGGRYRHLRRLAIPSAP